MVDNLINEELLLEKSRQELINKSKSGAEYSKKNQSRGKNRWERRTYSQVANSVRDYNQINMDAFFKEDILEFGINVHGETDNYVVTVLFEGILGEIRREVQGNNNKLEFKCVLRALLKIFNSNDVYVSCTCKDWCLKEDTKIKLLDGTTPTVKEMKERFDKGEKLYVFSVDEKGDFKPGKVNEVWISNYSNDMIRVTLDNGKVIETTPNHRYMLRDGSYLEAKDLEVGTSLMPLYFKINEKGYEDVKFNSKLVTSFYSVYKQVAKEFLQEEIEEAKIRSGEDVIAIHHKDFNKLNNNPENLKPMGKDEHYKYHYEHTKESGAFDKCIQAGKEYWAKQESKDKQAELMRETMKKFYANISDEDYQKIKEKIYTDEFKEKLSKALKKVWDEYTKEEYKARCELNKQSNAKCKDKRIKACKEVWKNKTEEQLQKISKDSSEFFKNMWKEHPEVFLTEKRKESNKLKGQYQRTYEINQKTNLAKIQTILNLIIKDGMIPSEETYDEYRLNRQIIPAGYPRWQKVFNSWEELSNYYQLNHKVKKIEYIHYEEPIPVYDIEVDKYNNFYVDSGVVLHNCYRFKYWAQKNGYNSAIPDQYTNMRPKPQGQGGAAGANDQDTKGSACKHVNLVISNLDWMMKVASVINNYIKWCRVNMERNYADYIFPQVYGVPYNKAIQLSLFDDPNDNGLLPSDQDTINQVINKSLQGRGEKGQWAKGNPYRFQRKETEENPVDNSNQLHLTFGDEKEKELIPDEEE